MRRLLSRLIVLAVFLAAGVPWRVGGEVESVYFTPTYRLVFYAVLEGCFEDGLTDADVNQILLRDQRYTHSYEHFINACPICLPTAHALETYLLRPDPTGVKVPGDRTFGPGLTPELHDRLYSADIKARLSAIHDLEEAWIKRRVASLRLTPEELARTEQGLKDGREKGMRVLQSFIKQGQAYYAPAYMNGGECAVCNAAVGMKLKLADDQPAHEAAVETPKP